MLLLEPLKVVIDDLPDDYLEMVDVPFSKDPAYGVCTYLTSSKEVTYRSDTACEIVLTPTIVTQNSFHEDCLHRAK